jgi:hypothetical protein
VVTNVGDNEGDTMCSVRMLDGNGREITMVTMLIASHLSPDESSSWVTHFPGRATRARSRCPAYDPGALLNVG